VIVINSDYGELVEPKARCGLKATSITL